MDEPRRWPALIVRAAAADPAGELEGLVMLALDDWPPLAIEDLTPLPLPSSGLWDSTAPPTPEPAADAAALAARLPRRRRPGRARTPASPRSTAGWRSSGWICPMTTG